jgi:eukaryotic-like serine/threonine-protein kinase
MNDRVIELLAVWEEAVSTGAPEPTPEDLCGEDTTLCQELARRISRRRGLPGLLGATPRLDPVVMHRQPEEIPGYEWLEELGRGGSGTVYKALQSGLNRPVAIKVIPKGGLRNGAERFRIEAETIARVMHPNVVPVYDVGESGGQPYLAMEYLAGGSLAQTLADGPLAPPAAAEIAETLARAVEAIHSHRILHRDLKPTNVLRAVDGTYKIADFGLAKWLDDPDGPTATGSVFGTPSYMAPEQAEDSGDVGPAADIYALGAILYECLTGRPPFRGASTLDTLRMVRETSPVPLRQLQPAVPRDLETICLKCLQKDPQSRYADAAALAEDLRRYRTGRPIVARPEGPVGRFLRACRRSPVVAGLSFAVIAATIVGTIGIALQWFETRKALNRETAARGLAEERREAARRTTYNSQMARLPGLLATSGTNRLVDSILESQIPAQGDADLRGFEWYHCRQLTRAERFRFSSPGSGTKSLAVRFDGRQLASVGQSRIRLWDPLSGGPEVTVPESVGPASAIAYLPNSPRLAVGMTDGRIRFWDPATQAVIRELTPAMPGSVSQLVFSPDGSRLAQGQSDGQVRLWTLADGTYRDFHPAEGNLRAIHFLQNRLIVRSFNVMTAWNPDTGAPVRKIDFTNANPGFNGSIVDSTGQNLLIGTAPGRVLKINPLTANRETMEIRQTDAIHVLTAHPATHRLATAGRDGRIHLWDSGGGPRGTLHGHPTWILDLAMAPDGTWLASVDLDGEIRVWSLPPAALKRSWAVAGPVQALAVNATGSMAASIVRGKGVVELWDLTTGVRTRSIAAHHHDATAVAFSPDGSTLATTGWSAENRREACRLWNASTGEPLAVPEGPQPPMVCVAFSGDTTTLIGGSESGNVFRRNWKANGPWIPFPNPHPASVGDVSLSADGQFAVSLGSDRSIRCWDAKSGTLMTSLPPPANDPGTTRTCIAMHPRGLSFAVGGSDGQIRIHGTFDGRRTALGPLHLDGVSRLVWSGDTLISSGRDGQIRTWNSRTEREEMRLGSFVPGRTGTALVAAGNAVLSADSEGLIQIWNLPVPEGAVTGFEAPVEALGVSPDSRYLVAPCGKPGGPVRLIHIPTGRVVRTVPGHPGGTTTATFAPDGATFATTGFDKSVKRWETATGNELPGFTGLPDVAWGLAYSPDGSTLATGGSSVVLWDVATRSRKAEFTGDFLGTNQVVFSRDGTRVAAAGVAKTHGVVHVWQIGEPQPLFTHREAGNRCHGVCLSPDGESVAAAFADLNGSASFAKHWKIADGEPVASFRSTSTHFYSIAVSPDGRTLATGQWDGSVRLWNFRDGTELLAFPAHAGYVFSVAFAPDGRTLASGGADGTVRLWRGAAPDDVAGRTSSESK